MEVLTEAHAGHFGARRMQEKIGSRFYWRGITQDTLDWVSTCIACQKFEKVKTEAPELKPIKPVSPWYMIGVDLIGPFKASSKGNRYCLTATDFFTKWVEAIPIKEKTAVATSQALMDMFYTHGAPEVVLTDQGREFWNKVNQTLFENFGVKHRITSAYHPQTNGLDERTNQTLKRAIGKTLDGHQERWEDKLKEIVFAHNSCVHASTRYSPYRLMYGREPRLLSEITGDLPEVEVADPDADDVEKYIQARAEKDGETFDKVRANVAKAQGRQKEAYQRRTKKGTKRFNISPGMEVLKKDERKRGRPGRTMDPDWPTKYRVTEVGDNNLVQLETMDGKPLRTKTPYASVKPLRMTESAHSDDPEMLCSRSEEDALEACAALLNRRVEDFRAMVLGQHTWLDDKVIDHAQALLKAQHANIGGLHATTSLALLSTVPTPAQGFVQILNVSANHWVTVSNIGCKVGTVHVFDSLGQHKTEDFIAQVTCLLAFPGKSVQLQWPDVQQQAGVSDCGLFAIANSLTLCRGEDPSMVDYHQAAMRTHLFASFQAGILTPFPSTARGPTAKAVHAIEVDVHCLCRRTIRFGIMVGGG
ncbi:hypothetical protein SKAU_G00212410 [Synaphobranchus kaupii]|uniref:Gypsy retrotransposon integrase-like protein 1 n=1 Tax=Synaphobranchus kaupii TaxID=118154 RepID=A0A9Q1IUP5_SYNKA|nr:hypothetical protein SKAU_G00212410 [Synaphobranchus kaupii]